MGDDTRRLAAARGFLLDIEQSDTDTATSRLSADVTYRVPGHNALAGEFSGPDMVARHLVDVFESIKGTLDVLQWEDWMVGTDHVAVIANIRMQRNAEIMTERLIFVLRFNVGDVIDVIEIFFSDQSRVDHFFR
jgi:ketosteroid isomerase-like protein